MTMQIEVFSTPGCTRCARATEALTVLTKEIGVGRIEWRVINIIDELDYAVRLGVLTAPSIVIDGELVITGLPSVQELRHCLNQRLEETHR